MEIVKQILCFEIDYKNNLKTPIILEYYSESKDYYKLTNGTTIYISPDKPYFPNEKPKHIIYSLK